MQELPKLVLKSARDQLFAGGNYPKPFAFNEEVVAVFDDMVQRSIPLYQDVTQYATRWAMSVCQPGAKIYDFGCSTGTSILHMAQSLAQPMHFIGIDNAPAMIKRAKEKLADRDSQHRIELLCDDLQNISVSEASFCVMNYTLQFVPVGQRQQLLAKIYRGMNPGGILFISEKVRACCPQFHETTTAIYENFKEEQGYSKTEIEKKKEALDQVLIPFTADEQIDLLKKSGFSQIETVMRWNSFASFVALKES